MSRTLSVMGILLLAVNCHGIRDLTINGSSNPVVTTGDSLYIHAWFEGPGAVAEGVLHVDLNGNEQLDPGDPWLYKHRLIDGSFNDEDESPNWEYSERREPFTCEGSFFFCAEDNGVADTVFLTVNPVVSEHCVCGRVTVPENQANILVCLIEMLDEPALEFEYSYSTFTDSTGSYSIRVPDESAGKWYRVIAIDFVGVAPGYASSDFIEDSVFVADSAEKDIAMQFFPDMTTICGIWQDDLGNPITGSAPIIIMNAFFQRAIPRSWVRAVTDDTGAYRIQVPMAGMAEMFMYFVCPGATSQFHPELMSPDTKRSEGFGPSPEEINIDLRAYRATSTISGHVYKDGEAYDKCRLEAENLTWIVGNTYTKTYSDGRYEMWISDACSLYRLNIAPESVPEGYFVDPENRNASPGDTGVDFHLRGPGVEEGTNCQLSMSNRQLSIHPNPFVHNTVVEFVDGEPSALKIYDMMGRLVKSFPFSAIGGSASGGNQSTRDGAAIGERLEAGVYFVKVRGYRPTKIVKLR